MTKFVCKNCDYKFESENEQEKNMCPYCGEKRLIKEPSVEDLLGED